MPNSLPTLVPPRVALGATLTLACFVAALAVRLRARGVEEEDVSDEVTP